MLTVTVDAAVMVVVSAVEARIANLFAFAVRSFLAVGIITAHMQRLSQHTTLTCYQH